MKTIIWFTLILIWLTGCSTQSVPKWKSDSQEYLEKYKYARLNSSDKESEYLKNKAIFAVKQSMNIEYLQIIELTDAAMDITVFKDMNLTRYEELVSIESIPSNNSYKAMLTKTLQAEDISNLPEPYRLYAGALLSGDPQKAYTEALKIENPLSRLIALGILADDQADIAVFESMLSVARSNGYRNVLSALLPRLSDMYQRSGKTGQREKINLLLQEMKRR